MDFRFSDEEETFRTEVKEFLRTELPSGWDEQFDAESEMGMAAQGDFARQFQKKLADRGWIALPWPKEYGGAGASVMTQMVYNEEMAYSGAPTGFNMGVAWVGPSLMIYGTEEQKKRFMPRITNLEDTWCTLYSEPGAGSDLAALQTRAVRDGDEWVINGQKIWTSGAHRSNWGWLAARTDPEAPKHKGISMFLVPMDSPGITIRPLINMAGQHGFNEVFFEDVRVPADMLVGQENMGWYQLVEVGIEIDVAQFLSYRVGSMQQAGKIPNYEATIAKLYSTELGQRLARSGIELLGMYGQLHPKSKHAQLKGRMERYHQLSVAETIAGGTSEVMRGVAAIRGLGLPRG